MHIANPSEWKNVLSWALLTVSLLMVIPNGFAAELAEDPPTFTPDSNAARSTIPEVFKWNLTPLFSSDEAWDAARLKLLQDIPGLEAYDGELNDPVSLRACLELLAGAGVDLTKPDALDAAMKTFEETLDEVEKLMATHSGGP